MILLIAAGAVALAGCSSRADDDAEKAATRNAAAPDDSVAPVTAGALPTATATPIGNVLTLEGLGALVVGKPVPGGSGFAERGAQINETCRVVSSPAYPGVYAIVEQGQVRRISAGELSDVRLVEGIGVGATEVDVLKAFPGFRATPHKYVPAPAKYLTQPGDHRRLLFEMGEDGRVSIIHVGLMPQLGYVEGCA